MLIQIKNQNSAPSQSTINGVINMIKNRRTLKPNSIIIIQNRSLLTKLLNFYNFNIGWKYEMLYDYINDLNDSDSSLNTDDIILIRYEQEIKTKISGNDVRRINTFLFFTKKNSLPKKTIRMYGTTINPKIIYVTKEFNVAEYNDNNSSFNRKDIVVFYNADIRPIDVMYRVFTDGEVYLINTRNINPSYSFGKVDMFDGTDRMEISRLPWYMALDSKSGYPTGAISNKIIHNISKVVHLGFRIDEPVLTKINGQSVMIVEDKIYFLQKQF